MQFTNLPSFLNSHNEEVKLIDRILSKLKEYPHEFGEMIYLVDRGAEKIGRKNAIQESNKSKCFIQRL